MYKKMLIFICLFSLGFIVMGCDFMNNNDTSSTSTLSDYEQWRNSNDALDLNGDRKIDETDYQLYMSSLTTTIVSTDVSSTTANTTTKSDYELWKSSEDAMDLNGDRKIDLLDYEIYQLFNNYTYWKDSDQALDMNSDRKIDETDYEMYKLYNNYDYWKLSSQAEDLNGDSIINEIDHEIYNFFDAWKNSELAGDLNNDNSIDVLDYEIFLEYEEFVGDYYITNFIYEGSSTYFVVVGDSNIALEDLGIYFSQMMISVAANGNVDVVIPDNIIPDLGDIYDYILDGTENMTINRISPFIVVIDTFIILEEIELNLTMYLTENENGYSTSYVIGIFEDEPVMSFNLTRVE